MIEYALLIMLGFCICGLIALVLAPTFWHRAVRLTTRRLEATMPMSLAEIEADKDLLRASYAIKLRRLEAGLNKAREKSAHQLVEISRHQMQIAELNIDITNLNAQLDERSNAANVFESTIRKRFPELEEKDATAQAALAERAGEIADLNARLRRREEALEMAQRSATLQQEEIRQLRETLERAGTDATGRFKKRASQWTLEEYRSEYDRLNLEMSRMREQLVLAQERENRQIAVLKTELQQLAERIMVSKTAAQQPAVSDWRQAEQENPTRQVRSGGRSGGTAQPAPRPWPGDRSKGEASAASAASGKSQPQRPETRQSSGLPPSKTAQEPVERAPRYPKRTESLTKPPEASAGEQQQAARFGKSEGADKQAEVTGDSHAADREALKSLLERGERVHTGEVAGEAEKAAAAVATSVGKDDSGMAADMDKTAKAAASPDDGAGTSDDSSSPPASNTTIADAVNAEAASAPSKSEPKLDKVFREILEGRGASAESAGSEPKAAKASEASDDASASEAKDEAETAEPQSEGAAAAKDSKTQTLLDRLRDVHERQTG